MGSAAAAGAAVVHLMALALRHQYGIGFVICIRRGVYRRVH